jgi:dihydroneopterin aldolase/2-amino-4-hydroxy-6-hydroxymethyldihydropteridine diphosphokinase/dihydropteroate synthase
MHSRGDAGQNKDYSTYGKRSGLPAVLEGICMELGEKVNAIVKGRGGVRRWLVFVDPGIGFSKTVEGNLEVLRHASLITAGTSVRSSARGERDPASQSSWHNPLAGYPQLIGASRKSFLGAILAKGDLNHGGGYKGRQTEAAERKWATAAAVTCAVQQGAAVVRVHDVLEMGDVVRVGTALWGEGS